MQVISEHVTWERKRQLFGPWARANKKRKGIEKTTKVIGLYLEFFMSQLYVVHVISHHSSLI